MTAPAELDYERLVHRRTSCAIRQNSRSLNRGAAYDRAVAVQLTVVGSVNLDLVARVDRLPRPGETLTASSFERIPGGKGANQAVAAARLGAEVRFVGCVGRDAAAAEALVNLRELELDVRETDTPTGLALIVVDEAGENQIVVVPGANAEVAADSASGSVLCQLEIPDSAIAQARVNADWLCINAAPARPFDVDADLVVANRYELEVIGPRRGLVALTLGAEGAVLLEDGNEVARATPPKVDAVDGTAAGDAFTAALVVSLLEGREREEALRRACAAGAIAASRFGAQPSLPTADEVDAILRR
jgi:ribokinase